MIIGERGNAIQILKQECYPKAQRDEFYRRAVGPGASKSIIRNQMALLDRYIPRYTAETYPTMNTVAALWAEPVFRSAVRNALISRNRRGISTFFKDYDVMSVFAGIDAFAAENHIPVNANSLRASLDDPVLHGRLVHHISLAVPQVSSAERYAKMTDKLAEYLKAMGGQNLVIIDYGTGTGENARAMAARFTKEGIQHGIVATDRAISAQTLRKFRRSRVAIIHHDISRHALLSGNKKADASVLGFVLPYIMRENAGRLFKNVIADTRTGGVIAIGGSMGNFRIFRKTGPNELELLHELTTEMQLELHMPKR